MTLATDVLLDANGNEMLVLKTARSGIDYLECLDPSYREDFDVSGQISSVRNCLVRWQDRFLFVNDMLGDSQYDPHATFNGQTTNLTRYPPEAHPVMGHLYASSASLVQGMGVPTTDTSNLAKALTSQVAYGSASASMMGVLSNSIQFAFAKIAITYTGRPYYIFGNAETPANQLSNWSGCGEQARYVVRKPTYNGENQPLPAGALRYKSSGDSVPTGGVLIVPGGRLSYQWVQVPGISADLLSALVNLQGHVNSETFDPVGGPFPPGTLLYESFEISEPYSLLSTVYGGSAFSNNFNNLFYDITYSMGLKINPSVLDGTLLGWNGFWRPDVVVVTNGVRVSHGAGYDAVVTAGDQPSPLYPSGDFGALFRL